MSVDLYIIIGLSRWPRGVAYVDEWTSGATGTSGKRRAVGRNRGLARQRGHGLRRRTDGRADTSKAVQTDGQADVLADGPNRAKIGPILARIFYNCEGQQTQYFLCLCVSTGVNDRCGSFSDL